MATILVTGANRGIGLALTQQLVARGDTVIAAIRATSPGLDALGVRTIDLDVADDAACASLGDRLGDVTLDGAILNAGILIGSSLDALDLQGCRAMFEVNALGPLKLAAALRPRMANPSRLAIITSRMGSMADNTSGGAYGYRMSKAAVNAAGRSLAVDLAGEGIAVGLLHPGWVKTDMTANSGLVDTDTSAAGLIARFDALGPDNTGTFWHMSGEPLPW